jgi:hypothetical protein
MTVEGNQRDREPTVRVPTDRPRMSRPLRTLTDSLKHEGCALDILLNRLKPNSRIDLRDPAFAKVEQLVRWISRMHAPADLGLESVLLDVAHFHDWPDVRKRISDDGWPVDWQYDVATEEFHRITDLVILCKYCHTLFDAKLIPKQIVHAAQLQMWAMPAAKPALMHFITTSLSHHSGHKPVPADVGLAVILLKEHHDVREQFVVNVRPQNLGMSYIVYPATGIVASRFTGDKPEAKVLRITPSLSPVCEQGHAGDC